VSDYAQYLPSHTRMTCLSFFVMMVTGFFLGVVARTTPICLIGMASNSFRAFTLLISSIG
jgi:hypothetical protein